MKTKYTQGNWYFNSFGIFDEKGGQIVSLLQSEQQYFKERFENVANAKLISAAPELLEILKDGLCDMMNWRDELVRRVSGMEGQQRQTYIDMCRDVTKRIEAAEAIIEKATK